MKTLVFIKKELLDAARSGKILILAMVFVLFGIMNPAIAKLTPWMMELLAEELAESGMIVGEITVDASTSWVQFFKNIPMALIVYILLCSNIFTKEYQSGTLILLITKGLKRRQVVIAKTTVLLLGWTVGYFLCFAITYSYTAYFWDNAVMTNLTTSILAWWLFGLFVVVLTIFFSVISESTSGVLLGTAAGVAVSYLVSLLPKIAPYTPTSLMSVTEENITKAIIVTITLSVLLFATTIPLMNKKRF